MNNNRPPTSFFQNFERETANQVSLALCDKIFRVHFVVGNGEDSLF